MLNHNYIINKEKKIPKEFQGYENQILDVLDKYEMIYPIELLNRMSEDNIEKVKVISYALALTVKDNVDYLLYKMSREKILSLYIECKNREKENELEEIFIKNYIDFRKNRIWIDSEKVFQTVYDFSLYEKK